MKTTTISLCIAMAASAALVSCGGKAERPSWLEPDSTTAINSRLAADFSLTIDEAMQQIRERYPELSDSAIAKLEENHYIETMMINGEKRVHYKSPRNVGLLDPDLNGGALAPRGSQSSDSRRACVDTVIAAYSGSDTYGAAHQVTYRYTVSVPYDESLVGDTLRVWLPIPRQSQRQSAPEILDATAEYIVSQPDQSVHSTLYMTAPAPAAEGDTAVFAYTARFITQGQYFPPEMIVHEIQPYNTDSDLYKKYTAFEAPHIVDLTELAESITAGAKNAYEKSEAVYDWIVSRYPWAGAREYSTIACIPTYVLEEGHGDCGQVALLYISMMRSLGIPARWESGWMMHPGELGIHDWAEVYFEGIGWVPVDVSFGRYSNAGDSAVEHFYSTGMDAFRFATNWGVCGDLYPAKKYLRSETVDFQLGEVEAVNGGNLFYPGWERDMELISVESIEIP